MLSGSHIGENQCNWLVMLKALINLQAVGGVVHGVVSVVDDYSTSLLHPMPRRCLGGEVWLKQLTLSTSRTEAVLKGCGLTLAMSGAISLQISARLKWRVIACHVTWLAILAMGGMVRTRTLTLPNLVSGRANLGCGKYPDPVRWNQYLGSGWCRCTAEQAASGIACLGCQTIEEAAIFRVSAAAFYGFTGIRYGC